MENETNAPVEAVSEPNALSLDDAVRTMHKDETESVQAEQSSDDVQVDEPAIEASEPDDFALAEGEEEAEGKDDEADKAEPLLASDEMVVEIDGEKIPVAELKKSRFLEADYTRSKQAIQSERAQLQELGKNFQGALDRVTDYLVSKLPPEPDAQLAYTDPQKHYQMNVMYQAALAEMQHILGVKQGAEQAGQFLNETDFKARMSAENESLIKQMPHLKDPKRMDAFDRSVVKGAKAVGITDDEIKVTPDHRLRLLAYHAAYGIEARANAQRAKAKVQAAPVLQPSKGQHPNSIAALEKNNALRSLKSSGSMDDAIKALMAGQG